MLVKINQSYWQRKNNNYACKLTSINIKPRTIKELNKQLPMINAYKKTISETIGWYLENREKFGIELDINRKCRALGIPAWIVGINIQSPELETAWKTIATQLVKYTMKKNRKSVKCCKVDVNELGIYSKMYQEIEYVKGILPDFYPKDNPFTDIMELMNLGAVIIRFKYIKIANLESEEKLITYHLWRNNRLLVHIEGFNHFIGWKYWGEGDEMIRNVFTNIDVKIRWGIDDFDKRRKFTY